MTTLIERLHDLHRQATVEHSHYYVGKVVTETIATLEAKDREIAWLQKLWSAETAAKDRKIERLRAEIASLKAGK